jgi:hypothetical protein
MDLTGVLRELLRDSRGLLGVEHGICDKARTERRCANVGTSGDGACASDGGRLLPVGDNGVEGTIIRIMYGGKERCEV